MEMLHGLDIHILALVYLVFIVDGRKQLICLTNALRGAEKQNACRLEAVVQNREDPFLQIIVHVNEQVPAGDQFQIGKRGVPGHIVVRKDHRFPYPAVHIISVSPFGEESLQPLPGNVRFDVFQKLAPAGRA